MAKCKQLLNSKIKSIRSKAFPKKSALYTIKKGNKALYAGKTNNLKRRVGEHLHGKRQRIDLYLRGVDKRDITVEYTLTSNAGAKEGKYFGCIMKKKGSSSLPLNRQRGNNVPDRRRRRRR
jgi:predicted GIY-YIG superfamily endonuclease